MREILFRGKRTDNGEWVNGYIIVDGVTGQHFIHFLGDSLNESNKVNEEGYLNFVAFEVDPETVCQYTGLTDKNGRKIFEGDIVKRKQFDECYIIGVVVWFDIGFCGFYLKCGKSYYPTGKDEYSGISMCDEVIGNIFDNQELLESEG